MPKKRRPLMAGNWKMNKTVPEAVELAQKLKQSVGNLQDRDVLICPPFTALYPVYQVIKDSNIYLGAQDVYIYDSGAYTGEISPVMLKDVGCKFVIIGHSERRHIIGETDDLINKKLHSALKHNLRPILCVGELLEEREAGKTLEVVRKQVEEGLKDVPKEKILDVVIAYEPVWAIGTGRNARPEDANEVQGFIRKLIEEKYGKDIAEKMIILYGGSVKASNIDDLMAMEHVDGVLVGGASLDANEFIRIVNFVEK